MEAALSLRRGWLSRACEESLFPRPQTAKPPGFSGTVNKNAILTAELLAVLYADSPLGGRSTRSDLRRKDLSAKRAFFNFINALQMI